MNTESGKELPFKNSFRGGNITDPFQVPATIEDCTGNPAFDGIILDSLTFLMDMYETQYVLTAKDSRAAWGQYAQFFKRLMQQSVAQCDKHIIFLAHTKTEQDASLVDRTWVPVKGSLNNNGIEAYFSTVVSTKRMPVQELQGMDPSLLKITPQDEALGFKYVFQTLLTKKTIGERIRGPMGLFEENQTYMDNDVAKLLSHMVEYYK
eukprot:Seg21445.1 transcript_id=Seg21445.1/GoldUCD/mRNA.D3Y31 product="hypothetical protein" protein_id=Seg21445.1/GoldUCD/D3Y31